MAKDFLTYSEYKLLCYKRGWVPLRREETGLFVQSIRAGERPGEDLSEVFTLLCNQNGTITRESLRGYIQKFGLDEDAIAGVFEIMEQEELTAGEFCRVFGCG